MSARLHEQTTRIITFHGTRKTDCRPVRQGNFATIIPFPNSPERKNSQPQSTENNAEFLTTTWLKNEVEMLSSRPQEKGATPWYFLADTGFWVKEQIAALLRNTMASSRRIAPDVLDLELSKVKVDASHFVKEYLEQMLNLKLNLAWGEVHGKKRIICPEYGGVLWESVTSKDEREGAVYETLFENKNGKTGIEEWLKTAPANSFAIMISPEGWSGLTDASKKKHIVFPETQMYAIKTNFEGTLQAYTLRYKADILENARIQEALGLPAIDYPNLGDFHANQKERIKGTLKNVAFIRGDDQNAKVKSFEDIVTVIQHALKDRPIAYEGKTFDLMRAFLRNPEDFSQMHPLATPLIERFQKYAKSELTSQRQIKKIEKNLQIALAVTVLQLNKVYRTLEKTDGTRSTHIVYSRREKRSKEHNMLMAAASMFNNPMDYAGEKTELEKLPGCAGGANKFLATSAGSSRSAETTNADADYDFDHDGFCVVCKQGPKSLGPCDICISCDMHLGGKAAKAA